MTNRNPRNKYGGSSNLRFFSALRNKESQNIVVKKMTVFLIKKDIFGTQNQKQI
ncbi:hypothetical protein [Flavobacterium sp. SLB02]|uniref:hypothetical protein n=1 Tax=Flavobacterium sp. SLB02 TaxID=2665645 RepID=UPI0012A9E73B|nr:hypothetical protein [Flavobacterium sp. SLB02]QGK75961.1 hypothetical protein GIY83_18385 [Flavobacterium sp. SLB02]